MKTIPSIEELINQFSNIPPLAGFEKKLQDQYNLFLNGFHPEWIAREHVLLMASTSAQWIPNWDQFLTHAPLPQSTIPHLQRHFAHTDPFNPALLRYTPDAEYGKKGRYISIKPGRYLKTFFPNLEPGEIREYASAFKNISGFPTEIIRDEKTILEAYLNGPISCMSQPPHLFPKGHVATCFAGSPNLALAIRRNSEGEIVSRTVVNTETKKFTKIYTNDHVSAEQSLNKLWFFRSDCLINGIVRYRPTDIDDIIFAPYIDRRGDDPAYLELNPQTQTATITTDPSETAYICLADFLPNNINEFVHLLNPRSDQRCLVAASIWVKRGLEPTLQQLQTIAQGNNA